MRIRLAHISVCVLLLNFLLGCSPTEPKENEPKIDIDFANIETIDYSEHVQPVFDAYCLSCHGGDKPAADTLYVSRFMVPGGNVPQSVVPIERSTMTVGDPIPVLYDIPHGIAISPSGEELYVASLSSHRIIFIDTQSNDIESLSLGSSKAPLQIAVSPDGSTLYATAQLSNELFVIDAATRSIQATLSDGIGLQPWHPVVTPDGVRVYVGNLTSNSVSVIDANSNTVLQPITGDGITQPHGSAVTSDGKYVFISNRNSSGDYVPRHNFGDNENVGTITVINTETNAITKVLEVGDFATGLGIWEE